MNSKAIEWLEENYPVHKRQVIIMTALKERLQYILEEREKAYNEYVKTRDLVKTDTRISFLARMENQIKGQYADVTPLPISAYVQDEFDLRCVKEQGFIRFMVSPRNFLYTYASGAPVKVHAIVAL